jgi:hypothetical protein
MKEAVAAQPGNAQQRDDLGTLYAQARDRPHAEQAFSEAIRLQPELAAAHLHLGFVSRRSRSPKRCTNGCRHTSLNLGMPAWRCWSAGRSQKPGRMSRRCRS